MPLPPRKWYTLQQAANKLTQETSYIVTPNDLIHYACIDEIELCIRIEYNLAVGMNIIGQRLIEKNIQEQNTNNYNDYDITIIRSINRTPRGFSYIQQNTKFRSEYYQISLNNDEVDAYGIPSSKIMLSGFFSIMSSLEYYNFLKLDLEETGEIITTDIFIETPRCMHHQELLTLSLRNKNRRNREYALTMDSFYILDKELNLFLKNNSSVYNEEFQETDLIKSNIEKPTTKNKGGRPTHPLKDEIITIAKATFDTYNSDIQREILANELTLYINKKHQRAISKKEFSAISEETVKRYLTGNGLGNAKGKSTNLIFTDPIKPR